MIQQTQPTTLYRHFDADGRLLYVGVALGAIARLQQHSAASSWARGIARIEMQHFPTRSAAIAAETRAIREESPAHNVVGRAVNLNTSEIGKRFLEARVAAGMTQSDVSRICDVTRVSVSHYENGRNAPEVRVLALFAKATGVTTDYLLFGNE